MTQILGIIPARGGSKGVPHKNIKPLLGTPLLAYTILEAARSRLLTTFIVSSDDPAIIGVAERYGAPAPFTRPAELATDESPVIDTIKHALLYMERKQHLTYEYVALLQPTSPMRTAHDIDDAITLLLRSGGDSLISVTDVGSYHPSRMRQIVNGRLVEVIGSQFSFLRRQDLPKLFILNGALYIARRDIVFEKGSLQGDNCLPYVMPAER